MSQPINQKNLLEKTETIESPQSIDVEHLMKLRLVVARFGEMDRCKWWNTKGMLANVGELALSRGFPKSHFFARARVVFAVAASRSIEVFDPPESITLWQLPVETEDQLDDAWANWLENPNPWLSFLNEIEQRSSGKLLSALEELRLISNSVIDRANRLRRADDLRAVPIKLNGEPPSEVISLLAAAYSCCEPGKLAVPFVRQEEFLR